MRRARERETLPVPAEAFLHELAALRRASPNTLTAYRRDLEQLFMSMAAATTTLKGLVAADVRHAAGRLHASGQSPASIARTLSAWRSFYRWLAKRGEVTANPVAGVRAPRRAKRLPKALPPDTAVRLAAHDTDDSPASLRDRALVELMYSSGLRLAETVSLDWQQFRSDPLSGLPASTSWIDLAQAEVTVTGKGRKTRSVPIGRAAVAALRAWLVHRQKIAGGKAIDPRALFLSARGRRLGARQVHARIDALARKLDLGVHVHPHMLRHSMASHVLQSSGDLRAVQELLGHANISTTQIYTQLDFQHLAKVYDAAHPRARKKEKAA